MPYPVAHEQIASRFKAYERERSYVAAIACAPLLILYVLVHTPYLRPYVPESKSVAVVVLILIPCAWFAFVLLLHGWLGPVRHGLRCPRCAQRLVGNAYKVASETGACGRCGAVLVNDRGDPMAKAEARVPP
jgi:hypothetical protein